MPLRTREGKGGHQSGNENVKCGVEGGVCMRNDLARSDSILISKLEKSSGGSRGGVEGRCVRLGAKILVAGATGVVDGVLLTC